MIRFMTTIVFIISLAMMAANLRFLQDCTSPQKFHTPKKLQPQDLETAAWG